MTGFDFLHSNTVAVDLSMLVEKANRFEIIIPPKFQLFLQTYDVAKLKVDKLYWEQNQFKYPMNGPIYEASFNVGDYRNLAFENFLGLNQLLSIYGFDYEHDVEGICSRKFIPFAVSGLFNSGGGFMVGTAAENADKIFIDTESANIESRFVEIENDVFQFVKSFKNRTIDLNYVSASIDYSKIYKNWDEDFWRIRNDQSV